MKIFVLLTCHNRKQKTLHCLNLLYSQKVQGIDLETFLVDDGCTDGTADAVRQVYPQVNLIQGDGTLFWNRGMCLAWEEARKHGEHDAVLWLNDDTMLFPDAVQTIVSLSEDHPDSIIVATIKSVNGDRITYGGFHKGKLIKPDGSLHTCDKFNGNCMFVPVSVSNKIGYLDPYYRHSKGDFDYAIRACQAGIKNIVAPVLGICDRNPPGPIWNKGNIIQRFKKLYSPLGNNPFEIYHIKKKTSTIKAIYGFMYIHFRVLLTYIVSQELINKINEKKADNKL